MVFFIKNFIRKVTIILCATLLFLLMTFIQPKQKAEAAAFGAAIPAGIVVGGGAYVVGVLALAALVGTAPNGSEYEEEMNAHALQTWEKSTKLAKDSVTSMIGLAKDAGMAMQPVGKDALDFLGSRVESISSYMAELVAGGPVIPALTDTTGQVMLSASGDRMSAYSTDNYTVFYNGQATNGVTVIIYSTNQYFAVYVGPSKVYESPIGSLTNANEIKAQFNNASASTIKALMAQLGVAYAHVAKGQESIYQDMYNQGVSKVSEAWQDMKDAGLVLPVDSAIPTHNGNTVNYNRDTDTYTGVDGGVINPSDLTWNFPKPRIRDGTETDVPAPLAPGVYVDTPPITGNPAIDGSIPKTTTNVKTGETTTIETDVPVEEVPGEGTTPGENTNTTSRKIDFKPLILLGLAITDKFPFSIPWDVFDLFSQFNVEPISPIFEIGSGKDIYLGDMRIPVKYDFDIDFSKFDPLAMIIRWGEILVFDICLIMALRRLTPD